jgi:hydrogenase nickel incorporation protein HypA/HybF
MHEVALMSGILDTLRDSAARNNITSIKRIKLTVGKFSMALPDSLRFAFEALGQEDLFQQAVLEIEEKEVQGRCLDCQTIFDITNNYYFVCSNCSSRQIEIVSGRELCIDYYEGD